MSKKQKVLILAGGGLFGAIPVYFLSSLGKNYEFQKDIDVLSGTSIGGIEASCYASGGLASDILEMFLNGASKIFKKRFLAKINPLVTPTYDSDELARFIYFFTGDKKVGDIKKIYPNLTYIVPALNMTKNKIKVFENITGKDDDFKLKDIALATSAAPTYFPTLNLNGDAITDGGVRENIPIVTTATTLKAKKELKFEDMDVLVLCTGQQIDKACGPYNKVSKWNLLDWALNFIVPDVTNSNESMSKFWGEHLGFNSFKIYNPVQIKGDMDDISNLDYMIEESKMYKGQFMKVWEDFLK